MYNRRSLNKLSERLEQQKQGEERFPMVELSKEVIQMAANVNINLSINALVEKALAHGEGELASNQALVVNTGKRTGRSPGDKFIVRDATTESTVDWNTINQSISTDRFDALWNKASHYLESKEEYYVSHLRVGAHDTLGIPVKVMTELAWHNLFAHVLFIRPDAPQAIDSNKEWTILNVEMALKVMPPS
jgi:phosphoenolpyruvate carboxykinase (ATP)